MPRQAPRTLALTLALVVVLVLAACSKEERRPGKPRGLDGDWVGVIEVPGAPIDLGLTFADGGATITIPAQGLSDAELTEVRTTSTEVEFRAPQVSADAAFAGSYRASTGRLTGTLTAGGQSLAVSLERGKVAAPERPQEPATPLPYRVEGVTFDAGDVTIAGTLTTPEGAGPFPAVVLLTGAGAQDRDEAGFGHKPFLVLSDALTRAGYAVLRTDDRGVGGTTGSDDDATYEDLTADALAMTDFLRARPEVDAERIGLLGHSQGGYLAPLAAARAPEKVAFVILVAGPAQTGCEVLKYQGRAQLELQQGTPEQLSASDASTQRLCDLLKAGDLDGARALLGDDGAATLTPTMAAQTNYDPEPALRALRVPTLALFGSKDIQVPPALNAAPMRRFLQGNGDATVHVVDGANHLMQPAGTGTPDEYAQITTTIDPGVLGYLTTWLQEQVPPA
ncbi:alpha/beta fold hydrolase [Nocardioides sp. LHD-245]|uniref:alpha/beta hydrolase family protein n=1 Tax=Nocardioides sp. LHD-245 TaxID=3051387 RepID=UPI0027DFFE01|nr:alpha/beta fold hydrolase [Nocardioides sp. LHD-245]